MEAHKEWKILLLFGLQDAIFGSHHLHDAFLGLETVGAAKMQDLRLVDSSKSGVDGG